jgi:hypothetical protein
VFWAAYPKKRNKGQAERTWKGLKPDDALLGEIIRAIERAKHSPDWAKDGGKYIPYPATWLNAKGWEDDFGPPDLPPGEERPRLSHEGRPVKNYRLKYYQDYERGENG